MEDYELVKREGDETYSSRTRALQQAEDIGTLAHPLRREIVKALSKKAAYPIDLARGLGIHEQKIYYHLRPLLKAGIIQVSDTKEIRGTVARKYCATAPAFTAIVQEEWKPRPTENAKKDSLLSSFFDPFLKGHRLNSAIVVGSPDPHGPYKARARDGHYAIDLGLFLGNFARTPPAFCTQLDVDTDLSSTENLIVVGGPVTNLVAQRANPHFSKRFSEKEPWGIAGNKRHTDDSTGLIARVKNPFTGEGHLLLLAGIRFTGTKAAVIGLTRRPHLTLRHYTGQKAFYAIVQGYDLDGDGKIDDIELLE